MNIKNIYNNYFLKYKYMDNELIFILNKDEKKIEIASIDEAWEKTITKATIKDDKLYDFISGYDGMIINKSCQLFFVNNSWDGWYQEL